MDRGVSPARAGKLRAAGWTAMLSLPAAYLAISRAGVGIAEKCLWADMVVYLLPILLAATVCLALAMQSYTRLEHWLWGSLFLGLGLVLVGESYWTWYAYAVDFHGPPLSSPLRIVYALVTPVFLVLVMRMGVLFDEPLAVRVRVMADFTGGLVVAYAFVYSLWMLPAFRGLDDQAYQAANAAFFPVLGTGLFAAAVSTVSGWRLSRWRGWESLLATAYAVYAGGLIAFGEWYPALLRSTRQSLSPLIVVLGAGMYLAFMAGVYRITDTEPDAVVEMHRLSRPRGRISHLYPAALAAALPLMVWQSRAFEDRSDALPVAASALVLAVVLAGRSWVSALDLAAHRLRAVTDPLTGVYNGSYMRRRFRDVLSWAQEGKYGVSIALVDIDMFRGINNSYGHHAGDKVLREVASLLTRTGPVGTEVFRLGGDDFAVVLPYATAVEAMEYASRARASAYWSASPNGVAPVGLSVGVASFPEHGTDPQALLDAARSAERATHAANAPSVLAYDSLTMGSESPDVSREDFRSRSLRDTVKALAAAVDARDPATRNHSVRVSELAVSLAGRLGLDPKRLDLIGMAALMHDVGKIGVPDEVLLKDGPLEPEERAVVEAHCELGVRILESANMPDVLPIVRHHHERWDGKGYPDRLKGHDIPLEARVLAVCDTYETLMSERPYKPAWDEVAVVAELRACSGTQFDPMVMETFLSMLDEGPLQYLGSDRAGQGAGAEAAAPEAV